MQEKFEPELSEENDPNTFDEELLWGGGRLGVTRLILASLFP